MSDPKLDEEYGDESTNDLLDGKEYLSELYGSPAEVIARYAQCVLCGSNLHFTHTTDFSRNLTVETSTCPECSIRMRRVMHRLQ